MRHLLLLLAGLALAAVPASAQYLVVPMDGAQTNHLKAYGLTYWTLQQGLSAEWLLNYRSGSFLLPDRPQVRREAALRGVAVEAATAGQVAQIRAAIDESNMESVILEKAPQMAIYTPPNAAPWDDAVTLALTYADIPYDKVWDREVLQGRLKEYDWLHLHHEDFTGQYSKFYINYQGAPWLQEEVQRNEAMAAEMGRANVAELKKAVAEEIRRYVADGGFLFAMCTATETVELALAALGVDIAAPFSDGTPADPEATSRMQWGRTFAFQGAEVQLNPGVNAFSDIDGHQVNTPWRQPLGAFSLFDFSAKFDPVPSMLVQNHENVLPDFYGLTTSFRRDRLKPGVIVLAEEEGAPWTKYVHGNYGEGTWTFLGGHDPEDPQHQIGDPPTDLNLHPHSPGYRLILNNVLFPAAKKKTLKT
ncbi:MAG: asparagine synthetase B [Gemmatimonadetes bacterium]|nr:asparagine synthetase B [Gemmatimonadota bacterium]